MRVYHHPRDLLCAHSACGCPEQPSPAFTFMFGRCQNRNLPTGYKVIRPNEMQMGRRPMAISEENAKVHTHLPGMAEL